MRVAFINTRLSGMSFISRDLCALLQRGVAFELHLFYPEDLDPEFHRAITRAGGQVQRIAYPWSREIAEALLREAASHPGRLLASVTLALWACLRSPAEGVRTLAVLPASLVLGQRLRRSGVTQIHGLWAGVPTTVAYWIRRHAGLPYTFSGHAWDITARTRMLSRKVASSSGMVVCSEFARRTVCTLLPAPLQDRVRVVHHGLDLSQWTYSPSAAEVPRRDELPEAMGVPWFLLAVGRLTPKKGFDVLLDACAILRDRGHRIRCEIIGPHARGGRALLAQRARLGLAGNVTFSGEVPEKEIMSRMKQADILVCPSVQMASGLSDGIPNVVLEAMALGLPVVGTHAGGLSEVLIQQETGLVVRQRDVEGLVEAIEKTLLDRPASLRRAESARHRLEELFDTSATTQQLMAVLQGAGHGLAMATNGPSKHPTSP